MQAILLAIPVEVLRVEFAPFLNLKEHVVLDSAICNKAQRQDWKNKLQGTTLLGNLTTALGPRILKWLSNRKMSIENILLGQKNKDQVFADCGAAFARTKKCLFGRAHHSQRYCVIC